MCNGLNVGSAAVVAPYVLTVAMGLKVTVLGGRPPRGDVLPSSEFWCWGRRRDDSDVEVILDLAWEEESPPLTDGTMLRRDGVVERKGPDR